MAKTKKTSPPQYLRVSLYFDDPRELAKVSKAADKAGRSRNNWIIRAALRVADEELGKVSLSSQRAFSETLPVLNKTKQS